MFNKLKNLFFKGDVNYHINFLTGNLKGCKLNQQVLKFNFDFLNFNVFDENEEYKTDYIINFLIKEFYFKIKKKYNQTNLYKENNFDKNVYADFYKDLNFLSENLISILNVVNSYDVDIFCVDLFTGRYIERVASFYLDDIVNTESESKNIDFSIHFAIKEEDVIKFHENGILTDLFIIIPKKEIKTFKIIVYNQDVMNSEYVLLYDINENDSKLKYAFKENSIEFQNLNLNKTKKIIGLYMTMADWAIKDIIQKSLINSNNNRFSYLEQLNYPMCKYIASRYFAVSKWYENVAKFNYEEQGIKKPKFYKQKFIFTVDNIYYHIFKK